MQLMVVGTREYIIGAFLLIVSVSDLRLEELVALTWDDIDFEQQIITVNKSRSRIGEPRRALLLVVKANLATIDSELTTSTKSSSVE